jgi:hypothetical protein
MNPPPPPPFGDPTNVNRENAAKVRKGLAIGCGGCGFLAMLGLAFVAGIVFLVLSFIRSQEPCVLSLKAAQASEVMKRELGEPMTMGWLVAGSVKTFNDKGTASVTIPIKGPAGEASIHTEGTRMKGVWTFQQMEATLEKSGQKVDLRNKSNKEW